MSSQLVLDRKSTVEELENFAFEDIGLRGCFEEVPHYVSRNILLRLFHHLSLETHDCLNFLQESQLGVATESCDVPKVCPLDPIGFHTLENQNLLLLSPCLEVLGGMPDNSVHLTQLYHENRGFNSSVFQEFGFSALFLNVSIDIPFVQIEVIVFELFHKVYFVLFGSPLVAYHVVVLLLSPLVHQEFAEIRGDSLVLFEEQAFVAAELLFLPSL